MTSLSEAKNNQHLYHNNTSYGNPKEEYLIAESKGA